MSDPLKPLFDGPLPALDKLARQAAAVGSLTELVRQSLPVALQPHVMTAARRGDDLVVTVDSAAWSARVRYAAARLREQLAQAGEPVAGKVRVRVGRKRIADSG